MTCYLERNECQHQNRISPSDLTPQARQKIPLLAGSRELFFPVLALLSFNDFNKLFWKDISELGMTINNDITHC